MGEQQVLHLFRRLPQHLRQEALDFMDFLVQKYRTNEPEAEAVARRQAHFGHAKGKISMSEDFDRDLKDFEVSPE